MTSNPVKEEAAMTLDKQAVEMITAIIEPHLAGPRGTSDEDYQAEQTALELAKRIVAALVPQEEEVGNLRLRILAALGGLRDDMTPEDVSAVQRFVERLVGIQGK